MVSMHFRASGSVSVGPCSRTLASLQIFRMNFIEHRLHHTPKIVFIFLHKHFMCMIKLCRNGISSAFGAFVVHPPLHSEHMCITCVILLDLIRLLLEVRHLPARKSACVREMTVGKAIYCITLLGVLQPGIVQIPRSLKFSAVYLGENPQTRLNRFAIQILNNVRRSRNMNTNLLGSRLLQFVVTEHRTLHWFHTCDEFFFHSNI